MEYIDINDIDIERLRNDLINIIGPATPFIPMARLSLFDVTSCSDEEVIQYAINYNIDIENYVKDSKNY